METMSVSQRISDEHLKAVGMVAAEWEYLSVSLRSLVGQFADMREPAISVLLRKLGTIDLLDSVIALSRLLPMRSEDKLDGNLRTSLESLVRRIDDLRVQRNDTVHAVWMLFGIEQDQHYAYKLTGKREIKSHFIPKDADAMKKLALEIADTTLELRQFITQCDRAWGTSTIYDPGRL